MPKNQSIYIRFTKPEAKISFTKTEAGKKKTYSWKLRNTAFSEQKAPAVKSTTPLKTNYEYHKNDEFEINLKSKITLPDNLPATLVDETIYAEIEDDIEGIAFGQGKDECIANADGTATIKTHIRSNIASAHFGDDVIKLNAKKANLKINYYVLYTAKDSYGRDVSKKRYLTGAPTTVKLNITNYNKAFSLNATQNLTVEVDKDNEITFNPLSQLVYKPNANITNVEIRNVYNFNSKGTYGDFKDVFEVGKDKDNDNANLLCVSDSELLKNEMAVKANKGVPKARTGYVEVEVTYGDGSSSYYVSKVTIKFTKTIKKSGK